MGDFAKHKTIIKMLYKVYKEQGFVSEEFIFETLADANLPLYGVDYICDQLLSMGVIIRDDPYAYIDDEDEDGEYDRSQTDYELLFDEVLSIDESLAPFIEQVKQIQPPQHREWRNLLPQAKNGNQYAYRRMILMYLRTVIKISLVYNKKVSAPLGETIQEGCIGLIMAIDKYEIGRQDVFPTYFPWWVRQNITRRIPFPANSSIYFPVHVKDKLYSIYEIVMNHHCHECREKGLCPTLVVGAAERLECSINGAKPYLRYYKSFESIEEILIENPDVLSDNGDFEEIFFKSYTLKELNIILRKMLETLTPKEKRILQLRFGIIDGKERTLEQVGNICGLTRERIRQIEARALGRLRHPTRIKSLKAFWES